MCTITATEFKTNFGKYLKIAKTEPITVTHRGEVVFETVPKKVAILRRMEEFIGTLPPDIDIKKAKREK